MLKPLSMLNKPVVVVDWGWLRGLPQGKEHLSNKRAYVIADTVLEEVLTTTPTEEDMCLRKLHRLLSKNSSRMYVGRYWDEIARLELPRCPVKLDDIIHMSYTEQLSALANETYDEWLKRAVGLDDLLEKNALLKEKFVQHCKTIAQSARHKYMDVLVQLRNQNIRKEWIQRSDAIAEYALDGNRENLGNEHEWKIALSQFPDALALGRWCRLILWYAMSNIIGETKKFGNNWYDAHYAFLASYTGLLATKDSGLIKTVHAVFPNVTIVD